MLEVMADYFKLNHIQVFNEIKTMFRQMKATLKGKCIEYSDLKTCLTPNQDRKEIVFVFDTMQIDSGWYCYEVFSRLIPLFDRRSSHSVLDGDFIDHNISQETLYKEFSSEVNLQKSCTYKHSSQFYFVYIHNISNAIFDRFNEGMSDYEPYIGYIDVTYSSYMKIYVSTILCNTFIKHKNIIIQGHEEDRDDTGNVNMSGYPFEENGYTCLSISDPSFGVFLSYKIERPVFGGFERDTDFAINAVSRNVLAIDEFKVQVDDSKLEYLRKKKVGSLKRSGLTQFTRPELEQLIRDRIRSSYIYNMTHNDEHQTTKFNILLEKKDKETGKIVKLLLSLEYIYSTKTLRLITMF